MATRPGVRFEAETNGADVGTATAFLLLPALIVLVAGFIFVGTGWLFGSAGAFGSRQFAGAVTVDAAKNAGTSKDAAARVLLQPGDYTLRVKDGAFSPWSAGARPPEGWFWVLQIDVGERHYELGDSLPASDRAAALGAHLGETIAISVDRPTEAYLWVTDSSPDDNEGRLVVQIDPAHR